MNAVRKFLRKRPGYRSGLPPAKRSYVCNVRLNTVVSIPVHR